MTLEIKEQPLITHYRPSSLDEVIGQDVVVKSLKAQFKQGKFPHCFLFTGPSGTGKTTLARILSKEVGADDMMIVELDAGTNGSVDNIRELCQQVMYMPPIGKANVIILDECHVLSKAAWNALLKTLEDCPSHVYFFFCTTEDAKVPDTVKTRATTYKLRSVPAKLLLEYGRDVICPLEGIGLGEDAIGLIADNSNGSPRQFLNYLSQCRDAESLAEVEQILTTASEDEKDPVIKITKMLIDGKKDLRTYQNLLKQIDSVSGIPSTMKAFVGKGMVQGWVPWNADTARLLDAIDKCDPYPSSMADILLLISRIALRG